jgi:urate oxidase
VLAKQNPVTPPELFASILSTHFPAKYSHIHGVHVKIITHRWTRMTIDGKPHPHSFYRDGNDVRTVETTYRRGEDISIRSGMKGLTVLKSTGSQFHGFIKDEYATLKDTYDRILSTEVDAVWAWRSFKTLDEVKANVSLFDQAFDSARAITMDKFAKDNSASVQATMYMMCEQIIADNSEIEHVTYELPNKHYFEIGRFT